MVLNSSYKPQRSTCYANLYIRCSAVNGVQCNSPLYNIQLSAVYGNFSFTLHYTYGMQFSLYAAVYGTTFSCTPVVQCMLCSFLCLDWWPWHWTKDYQAALWILSYGEGLYYYVWLSTQLLTFQTTNITDQI